ncbi:hypothetical protein ACH5RR_023865, partial [Cinchona calisaya]
VPNYSSLARIVLELYCDYHLKTDRLVPELEYWFPSSTALEQVDGVEALGGGALAGISSFTASRLYGAPITTVPT